MGDEFMNESHDVFILQLCDYLPGQLRETLIQKGYPTYIAGDIKATPEALKKLQRPILLVLCGQGTEQSFIDTKALLELSTLHNYPLILAGTDVDSYENILNQHFALATTLNTPCSNAEVLEAIAYIVRTFRGKAPETSRREAPTPEVVEEPAAAVEPESELESSVEPHRSYRRGSAIPEVFFSVLDTLNVARGGLGGKIYARPMEEEDLREHGVLPVEKSFQDEARDVATDVGRWGRLHLYRTLYFSQAILKVLNVSEELREQSKAAALLYSLSFAAENPDLIRREYYEPKHSALRKELCSRIKDSAMTMALELKAPEVGNLIATLGRLIGREEQANDSPISLAASAIMAADITGRVCFQSGHWNPRRTYSFLKRIKSAQFTDFHPAVLCCVVKFLNEAIAANPHTMILPKQLKRNPKLQQAAQEWAEQRVTSEEKKVALVNLMPGMRLSRPVVAFDGREILSSDVKLDQDLIWRLWQLATIRPLNGPVVVFSKN